MMSSRKPQQAATPAPTPKRRAAERGFTLVEMLVVIAIIAVIAAMLMPALGGAMESVRTAACGNNQRQIMICENQYAQDYANRYVIGRIAGAYPFEVWSELLLYLRYVPDDTPAGTCSPTVSVGDNLKKKAGRANILNCPSWGWYDDSTKFQWAWHGNYGTNQLLSNWDAILYPPQNSIRKPGSTLFAVDKYDFTNPGDVAEDFYDYFGVNGRAGPWHRGGYNVLFADGHTQYYNILPKRPSGTNLQEPWRP